MRVCSRSELAGFLYYPPGGCKPVPCDILIKTPLQGFRMRKYLPVVFFLFILYVAGFARPYAAGTVPEQDNPDALWIWSATGSQPYIEEFFSIRHPDIALELDTVPFDLLQQLLKDPSAYSGPCPDILLGEEKTLQLLQNGKMALPLDDLVAEAELSRLVPYAVNLARAEDRLLYGLLYSVTPVAVCYRRSLALEYLGTDDPEKVGEYFASWDALIDTARLLRTASAGEIHIASGPGDIETLLYASRDTPWILDGRLNIDETLVSKVVTFRQCLDEQLVGDNEMWSGDWFQDMLQARNALACFFPLWGYEYVIKPNTTDNGADWALCPAPVHRFWGAQILSIVSGTDRTDDALLFLKEICLSPSYELWLNERVREVPAHLDALEALAGDADMALYRDVALQIEGRRGSSLDMEFSALFSTALKPYYAGTISLDDALAAFRTAVQEQFPDVIID